MKSIQLAIYIIVGYLFLISAYTVLAGSVLLYDDFEQGNSTGWYEIAPWGGWSFSDGNYIGSANLLSSPASPSYSIAGDPNWTDYEFETSVKSIKGIDKQVLFHVDKSQNRSYIFNFRSSYFNGGNDAILAVRSPIGTERATLLTSVPFVNLENQLYKINIIVKNESGDIRILIKIDGQEVINYLDTERPIFKGAVGFEVVPGGYLPNSIGLNLVTETLYQYAKVTSLGDQVVLSVPNIKQYSLPWGIQEYDTAHVWAPKKTEISRYGCALTSATMILQYYGYSVTPEELNRWLLKNHGYVPNGLVDWSAVTRWVIEYNKTSPSLPKLEYRRINKFDEATVSAELGNKHPSIVKIVRADGGTHYVVVKGKSNDEYIMNDPARTENVLSYYAKSYYNQVSLFTPSNTDLSYIYFYAPINIHFNVYDYNGTEITGKTWQETPYIDQLTELLTPMITYNVFALPKPQAGTYSIKIIGNGTYNVITRTYDKNANLSEKIEKGNLISGQKETLLVSIGETNSINKIDYDFIRRNIRDRYKSGDIKTRVRYISLIGMLDTSEFAYRLNHNIFSKKMIEAMITEVKVLRKDLNQRYANELTNYLKSLLESL